MKKNVRTVACAASAGVLLLAGTPAVALAAQPAGAIGAKGIAAIEPVEFASSAAKTNLNDSSVYVDIENLHAYNGKSVAVEVGLVNGGARNTTALKRGIDYTASYQQVYSKNGKWHVWKSLDAAPKAVGYYRVTVKGKGKYTGTKEVLFSIIPPSGPTIKKLTAGKRSFTITWNRLKGKKAAQTDGYAIGYSTKSWYAEKSRFTWVYVKGLKNTRATVKKLKSGKTYYVMIESYKSVKGNKIMGNSVYGDTVKVK